LLKFETSIFLRAALTVSATFKIWFSLQSPNTPLKVTA
jgi:hypothetical protein